MSQSSFVCVPFLRSRRRFLKVSHIHALLQKGAVINCADKATGEQPLHIASALGHLDMISTLLRHGADVRILSRVYLAGTRLTP